jgi:hypothetical protein
MFLRALLIVTALCLAEAVSCYDLVSVIWNTLGGSASTGVSCNDPSAAPRLASKELVRPAHRPTKPAEISAAEAALLSDLQRKSLVSACWKDAIVALRDGCAVISTVDDMRSRVALQFLHCQVQLDGKRSPNSGALLSTSCPHGYDVKGCVQQLDDTMYPLYVQFRLHVDSLCFHAQEELFQERTEKAVFDLSHATDSATTKIQGILQQTDDVRDSLGSLQKHHDEAVTVARTIHKELSAHTAAQSESMELLSDRTVALVTGIRSAQAAAERVVEAHETGLAAIRADLGTVSAQQAAIFEATWAAAASLRDLLGTSVLELEGHRLLIENISASTTRIAHDANEQHLRVERANQAIFSVLEHVHGMQESLVGTVGAFSTGLHYFGALVSVMFVTAAPRTSSARSSCLLLVTGAGWTEVWIGVRPAVLAAASQMPQWLSSVLLSLTTQAGDMPNDRSSPHDEEELLRKFFRCAVGAILVAMVGYTAVTYESPERRIRRVIEDELRSLFAPRLAAVDAILQAGMGYSDGDDSSSCSWPAPTASCTSPATEQFLIPLPPASLTNVEAGRTNATKPRRRKS